MSVQPYLYPPDLFQPEVPGGSRPWVCIRTKSRAEKQMAEILTARNIEHFLPVVEHKTTSHRKTRISSLPLFSGYVFAMGRLDKQDFVGSSPVVQVLKPHPTQEPQLERDIWNIWKSLSAGSHLELTHQLVKGQIVEVTSGPLKGLRGSFERWMARQRMVLWVDLLGVGVSVDIPDGCVVKPV